MIDLALRASGLTQDQGIFKISQQELRVPDLAISSYDFAAYESSVLTNGPNHGVTKSLPQNLFFGNPPVPVANYPLIEMKGKIYSHYFPEKAGFLFTGNLRGSTERIRDKHIERYCHQLQRVMQEGQMRFRSGSLSLDDQVGIANRNPETIDISWFRGFLFANLTTTVLQVDVKFSFLLFAW